METVRHSGAGYPIPRFGTAPPLMTKEEYANRRPLNLGHNRPASEADYHPRTEESKVEGVPVR